MLTIPKEKLPTHIACIMDGNGRWANSRHLPRQAGHRAGADTVERCADFCMAHDIPWLTLTPFSKLEPSEDGSARADAPSARIPEKRLNQ